MTDTVLMRMCEEARIDAALARAGDTVRTVVDTVLVQAPDSLITIDCWLLVFVLAIAAVCGMVIGLFLGDK